MNGTSVLIVFVLLVAMTAGMGFLVDQLNRSAQEIMANRAALQDLQHAVDETQASQVHLQQQLAAQTAALQQKEDELGLARQALTAAQADVSVVQQRLADEQAARAALEQQAAALRAQLNALQSQNAAWAAPQTAPLASLPVVGAGLGAAAAGLPWALASGGLLLAGGILAWGRHERHISLPAADDRVVVRMTRAQLHEVARRTKPHESAN